MADREHQEWAANRNARKEAKRARRAEMKPGAPSAPPPAPPRRDTGGGAGDDEANRVSLF